MEFRIGSAQKKPNDARVANRIRGRTNIEPIRDEAERTAPSTTAGRLGSHIGLSSTLPPPSKE